MNSETVKIFNMISNSILQTISSEEESENRCQNQTKLMPFLDVLISWCFDVLMFWSLHAMPLQVGDFSVRPFSLTFRRYFYCGKFILIFFCWGKIATWVQICILDGIMYKIAFKRFKHNNIQLNKSYSVIFLHNILFKWVHQS